ncbi:hypothetical protein [Kitasatospora sp. MBT63]|uniref:hypothetical protein n=1 Tax=Kitasatospora sp. MBT63 TaxID=1444768 RepID=UPI00069135FC|nr:hypothetical protein [Kitasatospora sp. MBT63]
MSFPTDPLTTLVEMSVDGTTWTDITDDVYNRDPIVITGGRSREGARVDPGKCSLTLDNRSGRYSPRNPLGPYYGRIGRNTPLRVSVKEGPPFLRLSGTAGSRAGTPDHASLDITGDLDVRVDVTATEGNVWFTGASWELIGKYDSLSGNQRSWRLLIFGGALLFAWSTDGTGAGAQQITSAHLPAPGAGRLAVRATLDVNNGAAGYTATFYTAASMAGPWVQLGDPVVGAGVTSIFAGTAPLEIGDLTGVAATPMPGRVHAAQVRSGIGGTIVAAPDFTAQVPGTTSFADSAGRTWTLAGDAEITDRRPRFTGEIAEWPPNWTTDGSDQWTTVVAAGPMRRLGQAKTPLQSPMRRELSNPARAGIVAYWPIEDGTGATSVASAIPDAPPMEITGTINPARYTGWNASLPLPTLGDGRLTGTVPAYSGTGELSLRLFLAAPAAGIAAERRLLTFTGTGTAPTWAVWLETDGDVTLRAYDSTGTELFNSGSVPVGANGRQLSLGVELVQSGADINWAIFRFALPDLSNLVLSGTLVSRTFGQITAITIGEQGGLGESAVGHLALANDTDAYANTAQALVAWSGEYAQDRIVRLCMESQIPLTTYGERTDTAPLGPQTTDTILNLLESAAAADGGLLCERRDSLSLAYRARATFYNQPVTLALDFETPGEVPPGIRPVDDDQNIANDITIKRDQASSARAVLDEGALSVLDPPDGVGRYDISTPLNLYSDDQCADQAGWALHLGTVDEARYPRIPVSLTAAPQLIEATTALGLRDVLTLDNPPDGQPPDQIRQLAEGYTETLTRATWDLVLNCSPARPWDVATLSDTALGRLDTGGSALASAASSAATGLTVATTNGPAWTTDPADLPFDVVLGGERVTVTAVAPWLSDAFTRSVSSGWGSATSGQTWATAGGSASDYGVTGTAGTHTVGSTSVSRWSSIAVAHPDSDTTVTVSTSALAAGASQLVALAARWSGDNDQYQARVELTTAQAVILSLRRRVAGVETQLAALTLPITHTAGGQIKVRLQAYGTALRAKAWPAASAEPYDWHVTATDTAITASGSAALRSNRVSGNTNTTLVVSWDNVSTTSPQLLTVTRSVNGIAKAQLAGADIRLAQPMILAL